MNSPDKNNKSKNSIEMIVEGMTCNHCKESVESTINSFNGVNNTLVDLASGKVMVNGDDLDLLKIKEKIEGRGFKVH
tara:strand:- start:84 stop:314 length:231 start_codon:yes stop_codon:yes gene_type:complete